MSYFLFCLKNLLPSQHQQQNHRCQKSSWFAAFCLLIRDSITSNFVLCGKKSLARFWIKLTSSGGLKQAYCRQASSNKGEENELLLLLLQIGKRKKNIKQANLVDELLGYKDSRLKLKWKLLHFCQMQIKSTLLKYNFRF